MPNRPELLLVAVACAVAAVTWARSGMRLQRTWTKLMRAGGTARDPAVVLARSAYRKDLHTSVLYSTLAGVAALSSLGSHPAIDALFLVVLVPVFLTVRMGKRFVPEARMAEERTVLERRAEEMLEQAELAPQRWADRLAPARLPAIEGFEIGRVYEAGSGVMAGDFYDLYETGPQRLAAVIGDVSGHGIEPSITAFQVKYLLRVLLRQYRDPAQALEEMNSLLMSQVRPEELVSMCVVVFDLAASTLRFTSAGHPPAWLWHDGEVRPLRATGPLLTLDPNGQYTSREIPLDVGDVLVLYTDGLAEARAGEQLFGEDRIAAVLRRDPGENAEVMCKALLAAARDFATTPITDDIAILAVRRI